MLLRWLGVSRRARAAESLSAVALEAVNGLLTPFQRYAESRPHLLPADDRLESFLRWWHDNGGDPNAEDILDWYAEVVCLAGWSTPWPDLPVAPAPEVAQPNKIKPIEPVAPAATTVGVNRQTALTGAEAAAMFLAWVRAENRCGIYSSAELDSLYTEHAAAIGVAETPHNMMRGALKLLPGVVVEMKECGSGKRLRGKNRAERRLRSRHYTLLPMPRATEQASVEPWRQAA
jgi:hypothetical protein